MDLQRERRRSLNSLSLCGTGAIGLGLWSVIKTIMTFFANRNYIAEMISDIYTNSGVSKEEVSLKAVAFITYLLISAFLVLVFSIHLYVGKCANAEAKKGKKRYLYLIIALLAGFLYIYSCYLGILSIRDLTFNEASLTDDINNSIYQIAEFLLDLSSAGVLLALFFSAIRSRILSNMISKQEAAHEH